jgi:transposase
MLTKLTKQALTIPLDERLWNNLHHQYQQEYLRKKLKFIKNLYEFKEQQLAATITQIDKNTAHFWTKKYVNLGLSGFIKPKEQINSQRLSTQQKKELESIIANKSPNDYGFERYIWTGEIICELVKQEFGVELKDSRIYEILKELGLSHQKAHRDYDNADKDKQIEFQDNLKKNFKKSKIWKKKG